MNIESREIILLEDNQSKCENFSKRYNQIIEKKEVNNILKPKLIICNTKSEFDHLICFNHKDRVLIYDRNLDGEDESNRDGDKAAINF